MTTVNPSTPPQNATKGLESLISKSILLNGDTSTITLDLTPINYKAEVDNIIKYCRSIIDYNVLNPDSQKEFSIIFDSYKNPIVTDTYEAILQELHIYIVKNHYSLPSDNFLKSRDLNKEFKLVS